MIFIFQVTKMYCMVLVNYTNPALYLFSNLLFIYFTSEIYACVNISMSMSYISMLTISVSSHSSASVWACASRQTDRVKDAAFWHIWDSSVKQNKWKKKPRNVCQAAISCSHSIITVNGSFKIWQKQNSSSQAKAQSRHEMPFTGKGCLCYAFQLTKMAN